MNVTRIDEFRGRDTVAALRELLARAERNQIRSLVFAFKAGPKRHRYGITGEYREDPVTALAIVTRMEYKVNQLISEQDDEPRTDLAPL